MRSKWSVFHQFKEIFFDMSKRNEHIIAIDLEKFKNRLKSLINESGKSREKIAQEINISKSTIDRYCKKSATTYPPIENIVLLAKYFRVDKGYLLGDYDERRLEISKIENILNIDYFSSENLYNICKREQSNEIFQDLLNSAYLFILIQQILDFRKDQIESFNNFTAGKESKNAMDDKLQLDEFKITNSLSKYLFYLENENKKIHYYEFAKQILDTAYFGIENGSDNPLTHVTGKKSVKLAQIERLKIFQNNYQNTGLDSIILKTPAKKIIDDIPHYLNELEKEMNQK